MMSLLPSQSTTKSPTRAADEDADTLYAQARQLADRGDFPAATAFAALAAAAFAAKTAAGTAPLPIHPGSHEPDPTAWCQTCRAPNRRLTPAGQPCPRCSTDRLRVRRCRYCGVYLEKRPVDGPDEPWQWTDDHNNRSCPVAPDPSSDLAPAPEQDVWPAHLWAAFLEDWYNAHADGPVTVGQLSRDLDLRPCLPRTTYGEYHPAHLEAWLGQREGQNCAGYTVHRADETLTDDAPRWYLTRTEQ
uniref:hypothetical protein n=1 Tax=Streptomyces achromogenes TaxID=67255 RepID=UPI003F494F23